MANDETQANTQGASGTKALSVSERQARVEALQGWNQARESARRYDRNLLQYAGALAALLGISGGSGAVAAVGISVSELSGDQARWVLGLAIVVAAIVALIAVALIYYLVRAFRLRRKAEDGAVKSLCTLIALEPDRFWPS